MPVNEDFTPGLVNTMGKLAARSLRDTCPDCEVWLPVRGFEGFYEVSSMGRVRSLPRPSTRGGILRPGMSGRGRTVYPAVVLMRDGIRMSRLVHKLVAEAFIGILPRGMEVSHLNHNPQDNRVTNLRYVTHRENCVQSVEAGRYRGNAAKLSESDIREIVQHLNAGQLLHREIAERFGVTRACVSHIAHGRTWQEVVCR